MCGNTFVAHTRNIDENIEYYESLKDDVLRGIRKIFLFTTPKYSETQSLRMITENTELSVDDIYEYICKFIEFYYKKEKIRSWLLDLPCDANTLKQVEDDIKIHPFYTDKIKNDFLFEYPLPIDVQRLIFYIHYVSGLLIHTKFPFYGTKNNNIIEVKKHLAKINEQKPILSTIKEFFSKLDELNEKLRSAYPQSVITDLLNSPFDGCIYNEDGELISIQNFDND